MLRMIRATLAILALPTVGFVSAQSPVHLEEPSPRQLALGPLVHQFLRQPDGIEKLSEKVGDVVLSAPEERWGEPNLKFLAEHSDVVLLAKIKEFSSRLSDNGDSIETDFALEVDEVLRGTLQSEPVFTARGGMVTLSNGHVAVLHSALWDGINSSDSYLIFLKRQGSALVPLAASRSVLRINSSSDRAELLKTSPFSDSELARELSGLTTEAVKDHIYRDIGGGF